MTQQRKLLIYALIFILLFLGLLIIFSHKNKLPAAPLYKASATASNINYPYLVNSHTIDFFTGSSFASYNSTTNTTTTISPQFAFPTIDNMSWSNSGVLFQASNYSQADDLYPALMNNEVNTNQEYWWVYNFATQKISLLLPANASAQNITDAYWNSSGTGFAYIDTNDNVYLSTNSNTPVYHLKQSSQIIQYTDNNLYLETNTSIDKFNLVTKNLQTLVNGKQHILKVYVSSDAKTAAYVLGGDNPKGDDDYAGDLYDLNTNNNKSKKLLSDVDPVLSGNNGNLYAGYIDSNSVVYLDYYPNNGTALSYDLGAVLENQSQLTSVLPASLSNIYLGTSENDLVLASTHKKSVNNPINWDYQIQTDLYENGFEIHYFPDSNYYEIVIDNNPYTTYQLAAINYLKSLNIDPNQIFIKWLPGEGVSYSNPDVITAPQSGYAVPQSD